MAVADYRPLIYGRVIENGCLATARICHGASCLPIGNGSLSVNRPVVCLSVMVAAIPGCVYSPLRSAEASGGNLAGGGTAVGGKPFNGGTANSTTATGGFKPSGGRSNAAGGVSTTSSVTSTGGNVGIGGTGTAGNATSTAGTIASGGLASTGGTQAIGGNSNTGGSQGGTAASGGVSNSGGIGGQTAAGGAIPAGGTYGSGGASGTGCTGAFEAMQGPLCVAVQLTVGTGTNAFGIDTTEITRGQYEMWVKSKPALPASTDVNCGWKFGLSYAASSSCMNDATGRVCQTNCEHHPQVCVDWCDAYAYCAAVGKRLCGKLGGGSAAFDGYQDASNSQWYAACTSGAVNAYPYAGLYKPTACNGQDYWGTTVPVTTVTVASLAGCQSSDTGYAGVRDLSGNVSEWEDSCDASGLGDHQSDKCRMRGGSFLGYNDLRMQCNVADNFGRYYPGADVGFRCCAR